MNENIPSSEANKPDDAANDERLMLEFSQGDVLAFEELFRRYKQAVFGFFRRRVADQALAEELTQETFLAIVGAAARYKPQALFRTYLYAIAFHVLRAQRRKAAFRATFLGQWKGPQDPAGRETCEPVLILRNALWKLERTDREMLMLREFEELSYAEIAELLKIPLNTVRSRLFRARAALRTVLEAPSVAKEPGNLARLEERA
jgi:RNA polymerase sigma-70 factor, ECF subfamily